jgi:hypothetical protein
MDAIALNPALAATEVLESQITELAAHIHAATYRLLTLIRELDHREAWADQGLRSCAHWLNWKCGTGLGAGREKVRVAKALEPLPKISQAFSEGIISYSKVRAMTRIATPENETDLLNVALHGTAAHVEKLVRGYRRAREADELDAANARHLKRALTWYYDDDGSVVIHCRLDPEDGARVIQAINSAVGIINKERPEDVSAETSDEAPPTREPISATRADALVLMADTLIAKGAASPPPGERFEVSVHIDAGTLSGANPGGQSQTDSGSALCPETVRRLACDGAIVAIVEDEEGEPLSVGRRTRTIPPAIRRALHSRDRGCRFPGCTATRFVEGHHVKHWANGGETKLDNLITLCRRHHRLVHEVGFKVEADGAGDFRFFRPDGEALPAAGTFPRRRPIGCAQLVAENQRRNLNIDAATCVPHWEGETMDYGMALDGLLAADGTLVQDYGVWEAEV